MQGTGRFASRSGYIKLKGLSIVLRKGWGPPQGGPLKRVTAPKARMTAAGRERPNGRPPAHGRGPSVPAVTARPPERAERGRTARQRRSSSKSLA
jgi:hypothetical protein